MRAALSSIASNTGFSSPGDLLMTLSTSEVAVCCFSNLAQFVEQPRVLDGDHGLVSECGDQLDLLVGERSHTRSALTKNPDQHSLRTSAHHHRPIASEFLRLDKRYSAIAARRDIDKPLPSNQTRPMALSRSGTTCMLFEILQDSARIRSCRRGKNTIVSGRPPISASQSRARLHSV